MSIRSRPQSQRHVVSLAFALAFVTQVNATTFTWSSGDYLVAGLPNPLGSPDTINAVAGGSKGISTNIINNGRINWATTNTLFFTDGTLRNNGTFDVQADGWLRSFGGTNTVVNAGVLKKSAGTGELQISTMLTNRDGGTLDASSGTIRYTNAGTLDAGTVFAGAGINAFETIGGTYTFTDSFSGATNNVRFDRGNFVSGGAGPVDIRTNLTWAGGLLLGQWVNGASRTLTAVAGPQAKTLTGSMVNDGRINWASTNTLLFTDGTLRNNGTFDVQADGWLRSFGGTNTVDNAGVLKKSAGTGELQISTLLTNRAGGTLDASSGTIRYTNAGALDAGTIFAGAGINAFETIGGTYTFTDSFSGATNNVRFDRGNFVSGGAGPVDIRTNLTWAGGLLQGQWVNGASRTLTAVAGQQAKTLTGSMVNDGRINWASTNTLLFTDGTLRNNGTFDAQADGFLRSFGGTNTVENVGLITKSKGNGDFRITTALNNAGIIESLSGTIVLPNNWQNDGTLRGTAAFQSNVLTNARNISPGLSDPDDAIATLTIKGALTQVSTGFLSLDVTEGGISDLLDVTGAVTFGGTLHVNRVGNYVAQVGDIFRVATFTSFTGTLLDIEEIGFANGAQFSAIYSSEHLDIVVNALAVPEPATYALMVGGLLGLWGLKRRRQGATAPA